MIRGLRISILVEACLFLTVKGNVCPPFDNGSCSSCGVLVENGCSVGCKTCEKEKETGDNKLETKSEDVLNWNPWSIWGKCLTECGFGYKTRLRECRVSLDNSNCDGLYYEFDSCYISSCGGEIAFWDSWSEWSSCNEVDGGGKRFRTRNCKNGVIGQDNCDVNDVIKMETCINVEPLITVIQGGDNDNKCFDRRFPSSYRGNVRTAWYGQTCLPWSTRESQYRPFHYPNEDLRENFCRNPDAVMNGPWCYVDDNRLRKLSCQVPICAVAATWTNWLEWSACSLTCGGGQRSRIRQCLNGYVTTGNCIGQVRETEACSTNLCPKHPPPQKQPRESKTTQADYTTCASLLEPESYRGTASLTMEGYACQRWDSDSPHRHSYDTPDKVISSNLIENYCRDPDDDIWPWCITTDPNQIWDYCKIDQCEYKTVANAEETCYNVKDPRSYRGTASTTVNGITCQNWDDSTPHQHTYKFFKYPNNGLESNYCRTPDNDGKPWCITTDPNTYWDYCNVPLCPPESVGQTLSPQATCGDPLVPIKSEDEVSLRVVGGMGAYKNSMPWIVALQNRNHYAYCGASIVSQNWILTAAHCIQSEDPSSYEALVGNYRFTVNEPEEKIVLFQLLFVHENFDGVALFNDIALFKTTTPIEFNEYVKPVCLPTKDESPSELVGKKLIIAGWGSFGNNQYPDSLEQAYVPVVSTEYCKQVYERLYGAGALNDGMLCAGYESGGIDTCQGDSGGPLVDTENFKQVGIVSWGKGCAKAGYPGVYTSVAYFRDWMDNIMNNN